MAHRVRPDYARLAVWAFLAFAVAYIAAQIFA